MPAELIIGANGYLGQSLARAHRGRDCLLHSRTPAGRICRETGLPFVQEDLVESRQKLAAINPETVYLLSRPSTQDAGLYLDFAQNIQWLLQEWADRKCLRRVVFASTQLVYATPPNDTPIPTNSPLGPETPYDCHKAEMEFFLALLAHHACGVKVDVYRLPLLAGSPPTPAQARQQFLFEWRAGYQSGYRFQFPTDDPRHTTWGNSWAHVDDVVRVMIAPPALPPPEVPPAPEPGAAPKPASRFRILQPVSGHISYLALDAFFQSRYKLPPMIGTQHLAKTTFYLEDNAHCPPRPIEEAFPDNYEVADENSPH